MKKGKKSFQLTVREWLSQRKKTLRDCGGNGLYRTKEQLTTFSMRDKQYMIDAESGETVFTLLKAGHLLGRNTITVFEGDYDNGEPVFVIAGDFFEKDFHVANAKGDLVCEIARQLSNIAEMIDKGTYAVQVETGQDAVLMLAFAVELDEIVQNDA